MNEETLSSMDCKPGVLGHLISQEHQRAQITHNSESATPAVLIRHPTILIQTASASVCIQSADARSSASFT